MCNVQYLFGVLGGERWFESGQDVIIVVEIGPPTSRTLVLAGPEVANAGVVLIIRMELPHFQLRVL